LVHKVAVLVFELVQRSRFVQGSAVLVAVTWLGGAQSGLRVGFVHGSARSWVGNGWLVHKVAVLVFEVVQWSRFVQGSAVLATVTWLSGAQSGLGAEVEGPR
jgi:hypothetical protein